MKKLFIAIFLITIPILGFAQTSVVVFAGTTNGIDHSYVSDAGVGINAGATIDFRFKKHWSFQTGMNYTSVFTDTNYTLIKYIDSQNIEFDEGYISKDNVIQLPANLCYSTNLSSNANMQIHGGLFFGIAAGGLSLYRSSAGMSDYAVVTNSSDPVHIGTNIGAGIEINRVYIGIEGSFNLTDPYLPQGALKTKLGIRF